jgi:hypothetical protein
MTESVMTGRLSRAELDGVVRWAAFAPSILNVQPWGFVATDDSIELHRDSSRTLPVLDPRHRALTISCGAALFNLRVAIAALGRQAHVQVLPDPSILTLLATVHVYGSAVPSSTELRLYDAVPRRSTTRLPFVDQPIAPESVVAMQDAAQAEHATLRVLPTDEAVRVTQLVRQADFAQRLDLEVRGEVAAWTARPVGSVDGLPDNVLGPAPRDPSSLVRDFAMGRPVVHRPTVDFERETTLAILSTDADDIGAWMRAGQALERVWLEATAAGLSVSLLTQPLEVSYLRWLSKPPESDQEATSGAARSVWPQVLMRIGVTNDVAPHTPRRPVEEILEIRAAGLHPTARSSDPR